MTVVTQDIPLVDLKSQYATIRDEVRQAIDEVLESMQLTIGPNVRAFDKEWAEYCGTAHSIGVGSGTDALQLAIRACGVSSGDEVITVSHTFFATVEAIVYANARPILVDVEERSMLMDISSVASRITPRTKAIIPVHLYGRTVDLKPLRQLAQDRGITIIEDAAQAHGALLDDGKKAGTGGRVNCFSFYCSKNLGAYGEAGSITTNDEKLAEDLRALREHGQSTRYYHPIVGYNARLDEIQAAILRIKLRHLDEWNARRQAIAAQLQRAARRQRHHHAGDPARRAPRLLLLRDPRAGRSARCASRVPHRARHRDADPLPRADPHAGGRAVPRVSQGRSAGDGEGGRRGPVAPDVRRADGLSDRPRRRKRDGVHAKGVSSENQPRRTLSRAPAAAADYVRLLPMLLKMFSI